VRKDKSFEMQLKLLKQAERNMKLGRRFGPILKPTIKRGLAN